MPAIPPHADWARLGRAWIPRDAPGCILWLRADLGVTLATGVSAWADQSGKGNNCSQGNTSKQPALLTGASGIGGKPALSFDTAKSLALALTHSSSNYLIVAAMSPATVTGDQALVDTLTGRLFVGHTFASTSNKVSYLDSGGYHSGAATTAADQVLSWDLRTSPGGKIFKNGSQLGTTTTYAAMAFGGTTYVGANAADSGGRYNGKLAELVILDAPSDAVRSRIERYMGARYGIAVA